MINRHRAEEFSRLVALELKGKITTYGFTAKAVADGIDRPAATMNRWLNGKLEMPISVLGEACEFIDIDPQRVVEDAYSRLAVMYGERNGLKYEEESVRDAFAETRRLEQSKPDDVGA